ncbi:nuclear transport factor 2 family protein [Nocardioides sp. HM23]|uniref:nuclear transport factor 2 family protein n=1 Tax=Nocardioides bizhenqiangii TaxID=3095076 RepID=UPI002ACA17E5|nr:nuclear transport factor 2 family protein [Nocardioides sp. HM23]MDZ5622405.1 nuclear transport factor 2 family protein [Nocardioides sp. HM23]
MTRSETSSLPSVAVLGLGRMGAAMARRLHSRGHPVVTWSRSGRIVDDLTSVASPSAAVGTADVVLLCLFDGPACSAVVTSVRDHLDAGTVVVNTSTVGVHEAVALDADVRGSGAAYVHAPVMGSVPAVQSGALTVLVGSGEAYGAPASTVLDGLGDVLRCGAVADAAAAKLLANGVLGGAVLNLRDALIRAEELGIQPGPALSVLERTILGRLVGGKRDALEKGDFSDADFTVGALAKDLTLLAAHARSAEGLRDSVIGARDRGVAGPDDDIVALCAVEPGVDRPHRLSIAPGVTAAPEVLAPLEAYVAGHATGDASHHRRAFLPTAHIEGVRDGELVSWPLDDFCTLFKGQPAADETQRRRRIDRVEVAGSVANATLTLHHGADVFTDLFLLVRVGEGWRIANKAYHRSPSVIDG